MTERVDWDRLADFVGGALDGTPDADAVRQLIADHPAWATAHADLTAADAAVRTDLAGYAGSPAPLPDTLADRLDAFVRTLDASPEPARADPAAARGGRPGSGPRAARGGSTGPGRTAQRRRVAVLSAAAAVIAVAVGLLWVVPQVAPTSLGGSGSADSAAQAPAVEAPAAAGGPVQVTSGRDYQPGGFGPLVDADTAARASDFAGAAEGGATGTRPGGTPGAAGPPEVAGEPGAADQRDTTGGSGDKRSMVGVGVPAELQRLTDPVAQQACLRAVEAAHGGTATAVDYARFAGRPALVVLLAGARTGGGRQWIVVAGPDCGLRAGLVDERYNGPAR